MSEPVDIYSDQFQFNLSPYGCTLNFMLTDAAPPAAGLNPQAQRMATVRMSIQHLKVMTFILRRQVVATEEQTGVRAEIPNDVLNSMRISREDWDSFWRRA